MNSPLNHQEAHGLFVDAMDGALPPQASRQLETHLADCASCRSGFQAYSDTVLRVRDVPRLKAPPGLATQVMRRVRRQRPGSPKSLWMAHVHQRFPAEVVVTLLLAAAVAVVILLAAA